VVCEIFQHGHLPYEDVLTNAEVMDYVSSGQRMPLGPRLEQDRRLRRLPGLLEDCWAGKADARPSFRMISEKCRQILESLDSGDSSDSDRDTFATGDEDEEVSDGESKNTDAATKVVLKHLLKEAGTGVTTMFAEHAEEPSGGKYGALYASRLRESASTSPDTVASPYAHRDALYSDHTSSAFYTAYSLRGSSPASPASPADVPERDSSDKYEHERTHTGSSKKRDSKPDTKTKTKTKTKQTGDGYEHQRRSSRRTDAGRSGSRSDRQRHRSSEKAGNV
jgi:Protein tyrosine and serine/threonine kinase